VLMPPIGEVLTPPLTVKYKCSTKTMTRREGNIKRATPRSTCGGEPFPPIQDAAVGTAMRRLTAVKFGDVMYSFPQPMRTSLCFSFSLMRHIGSQHAL
jgi:hypothetical protein